MTCLSPLYHHISKHDSQKTDYLIDTLQGEWLLWHSGPGKLDKSKWIFSSQQRTPCMRLRQAGNEQRAVASSRAKDKQCGRRRLNGGLTASRLLCSVFAWSRCPEKADLAFDLHFVCC